MSFASRFARITVGVIVTLAVVSALFFAFAWHSSIDPVEPPTASAFDHAVVLRGAQLAALGECVTCHTAADGRVFAGGRAIPTPFGTIYSTNITPDPLTGIGQWSLAAFERAMRAGVDRKGRDLYPAFPYDHFTLLRDEDVKSLYAYLMTRQPVRVPAHPNELDFPLNFRPLLAGWKLLFFRQGRYRQDRSHDETWNRGAYLAEGLAHCGACHTPRNLLGAEKKDQHFGGGESENWHAYAINSASQSPVPWEANTLQFYLRNGWHALHGVARGPMTPVVENMAGVPETDVQAMAAYVISLMGQPTPERVRHAEGLATRKVAPPVAAQPDNVGATLYTAACAVCHESGRPLPFGGIDLALSIGVSGEDPTNLLHVVLEGLPAAGEAPMPIMPGFAHTLSDPQLLALLTYLRSRFAAKPLWSDTETAIRHAQEAERRR
ncbi:MAG: alcohol dehydrogenase [Gammaproteobacteria bacterium]|nr:alcohol dehydrogenase [Gammaproteobacteria bacterium]